MITFSLQNVYYIFVIVSSLCGASFKPALFKHGYEIGKNKRK
jgi:hypothetical protein